jgi:hypothetical protein
MSALRGADLLAWVVGLNLFAAGILVATALVIAYHNLGSRNIALGAAALIAAVIGFGLQLWFDLRTSSRDDQVSFAYTIDFLDEQIRQWDYTKILDSNGSRDGLDLTRTLVSSRIGVEIEAGRWLFSQHRNAVEQDPDRVASDFAVFSLVEFFAHAGGDWQWQFRRYNSPTMSFSRIVPTSKREECSVISGRDLRQQLSSAKNLFSGAPDDVFLRDFCLPAGTTIQIGTRQVLLRNRMFHVAFTLEDTGVRGADHMQPSGAGSPPRDFQPPRLDNGRFRYDTRIQSFVIQTTFSRFRAYAMDKPKYEAWAVRLTEMVKAWFACC